MFFPAVVDGDAIVDIGLLQVVAMIDDRLVALYVFPFICVPITQHKSQNSDVIRFGFGF